ncbi:MAG: elongation factor G-like protein EF-G2 [Propionibacteriaceae bacterium]|jgi:elongation factor G|nr:elongation factor G-like protein EF-G2 [Propionibacteriaceae bacterium]
MASKASTITYKVSSPADLRNVVLVGSAGSGKTTLYENLLKARIAGYRGEKEDPERAAALALASISNNDVVINLIDAPGHPDFAGELRAALRASDAAVFVVSAADGVDASAQMLWNECRKANKPCAVVLTKLDAEDADFDSAVENVRAAFGDGVHPAYIPLTDAKGTIIGNLSLLSRRAHDYSAGERVARDATADEVTVIENFRGDYVESIITEAEDEELMESYLMEEDIPNSTMVDSVMKAMYHGTFFPVLPVLGNGVGIEELIGLIERGFPTPLRRRLRSIADMKGDPTELGDIDPAAPLVGQVIRTSTDPFAGRLSMVRIFNGTLKADSQVQIAGQKGLFGLYVDEHHPDHVETERIGQFQVIQGTEMVARSSAVAGEIVLLPKLTKAETADTISSSDNPLVIEPWPTPTPLLPIALQAATRNDEDKLATALNRLTVEDSSVLLQRSEGTDQLLIWTMGQAHKDLVMNRIKDRYSVNVTEVPVKVALRETFIAPAQATGSHKKQSGGHGQFGVCHIRVEPLPRGAGFEFVDEVVGGAVPRQYIPSVEKGIRSQLEKGTISGNPMVDVKVILDDGKSHPVDSSDMAFQTAGQLALKEAATADKVALLEPLDDVTVTVADEFLGTVMTDISNRRGQVLGNDQGEPGTTVVRALVPQSELARYAIDLRGLAKGSGTFTRSFHGYELMPPAAAAEIIKAAQAKG